MSIEKLVPQEEQDIDYVRTLRKTIINSLVDEKNKPKSTDTKDIAVLGSLLSDMDRTALSIKRLKLEEVNSKNGSESAALIASILTQLTGKYMRPEVDESDPTDIPFLAESDKLTQISEGLADSDPGNETYSEFKKRMDGKFASEEKEED